MMRSFSTLFFLSLMALSLSPVVATPTYLHALSDVPIAEGLSLEEGSEVIFDVPEGKIVEVKTFGPLDIKEVQKFYQESLVALGWQSFSKKPWTYQRSDEILEISFDDGEEDLQVKFRLTPRKIPTVSATPRCSQK